MLTKGRREPHDEGEDEIGWPNHHHIISDAFSHRSGEARARHYLAQNCGTNIETTMNPTPTSNIFYCSQCGQPKLEQELAHFGDILVCGSCKPAYAQGLNEGIAARGAFHYAGFWIRFVAYLIDALIVGFASVAVQAILLPRFR